MDLRLESSSQRNKEAGHLFDRNKHILIKVLFSKSNKSMSAPTLIVDTQLMDIVFNDNTVH